MSVTTIVPVRRLGFEGSREVALPTGIWYGRADSTGDGSAGQNVIQFQFKPSGQPAPSELYSLEHIVASGGSGGAKVVELGTTGMLGTFGFDYSAALPLVATTEGSSRLTLETMQAMRGTFLGEPFGTEAASEHLQAMTTNASGVVFSMLVAGYVWGVRAKMAPGGPRRPAPGIFAL